MENKIVLEIKRADWQINQINMIDAIAKLKGSYQEDRIESMLVNSNMVLDIPDAWYSISMENLNDYFCS